MSSTRVFQVRPGVLVSDFPTSTYAATYRIELPNGTHFQVTSGFYHLLECLRTPMTLPELAVAFAQRTGQAEPVEKLALVVDKLVRNGAIVPADQEPAAAATPMSKLDAYLGLHFRRDLVPAKYLAPIAARLGLLFRPVVVVALLGLAALTHLWVFAHVGIPPNVDIEQVSWPLLYIVMTIIMLWHEFGHLAACHYYGCPHGPLGVALYMLNPAVYVNVTGAYRLKPRQRAVIDAGGIFFQFAAAPILALLFWWTNDATFLLIFLFNDLVILDNLEPFYKLDGYHLLADLTSVPNLHTRTAEYFKYYGELLLWRLGKRTTAPVLSAFGQLSPKVRRIILGYTLVSLVIWPLLLVAMLPMLWQVVISYPALWYTALLGTAEAMRTGDLAGMWSELQVLFLPTLMVANVAVLVKVTMDRRRNARIIALEQSAD